MTEEAEAARSPVAIGEVLAGKYRIDRVLGQGGMGIVVAATHVQLRQRVAIKFLLHGARGDIVTRFLREARAAARLKSEHVARVLDVGELPNGSPFMVMEFLEGSDLEGVLADRGPLPIEEAIFHLLQACEAIAEAHAAGIVHRDLKPANLFLASTPDGSGSIKVLDFGISKDTTEEIDNASPSLTRTTAVLGSPSYMAPEQMRSTRDADVRADVWSLGVILYELLTGEVPFVAESFVELALKVISDEPPSPRSYRADLSPALEAAILRCLQKDPAVRFANVTELAFAIAPFGAPGAAAYAERIARVQGLSPRPSGSTLPPVPLAGGTLRGTQVMGGTKQAGTISATGWAGGAPSNGPNRRTRAGLFIAGAVAGGLAILGGAAMVLRGEDPGTPAPVASPPKVKKDAPAAPPPKPPTVEAKTEPLEEPAALDSETTAETPVDAPQGAQEEESPSPSTTPAASSAQPPVKKPKTTPPPPAPTPPKPAPQADTPRPAPKPTESPKPAAKKNPLDMDIQ